MRLVYWMMNQDMPYKIQILGIIVSKDEGMMSDIEKINRDHQLLENKAQNKDSQIEDEVSVVSRFSFRVRHFETLGRQTRWRCHPDLHSLLPKRLFFPLKTNINQSVMVFFHHYLLYHENRRNSNIFPLLRALVIGLDSLHLEIYRQSLRGHFYVCLTLFTVSP